MATTSKRIKWNKKDLMEKYPIGTPVAHLRGYPSSELNTCFGVVTGYDNETYRSTWGIIVTRCDGHETSHVPAAPEKLIGFTSTSAEVLALLEAQFKKCMNIA